MEFILYAAIVLLVLWFIFHVPRKNKRAEDVMRSNDKRRREEGWK